MSERIRLSEAERRVLFAARRRTGMRIKALSRVLGVSPGAIMKYQWGERRVPADVLLAWRQALGVSTQIVA